VAPTGQTPTAGRTIAPLKPTRILSSPYLRCQETVRPLAEHTSVEVERTSALAPDAPLVAWSVIRELSAPGSLSGVVLGSHGEVIDAVLTELAAAEGMELTRRPPGQKGCVDTG